MCRWCQTVKIETVALVNKQTIAHIQPESHKISSHQIVQNKMTPASRIRESISSLKSQSAWSPMPEHLMFQQIEDGKSPTTYVTPDVEKKCEECGMRFKTEAMLTYHSIGFCVGPPTEEIPPEEISPRAPFRMTVDESAIMLNNSTNAQSDPARGDTVTQVSKQEKLEWCECANGAVPPSAVKVGYDDSDQIYTYICVAQVGDEVIPGTVLPHRKHATVPLNSEEVKATEYSVLADRGGTVSWKRCDVVGGIPRGAVKGGYDSKNLQYFIARGKAPDGNWCCGKYIPQKQQCYFAWEGTEFTTKDFEFLCKNTSKQYFSNANTVSVPSVKSRQTTEYTEKPASQDRTRDFTDFPPSQTELSLIEEGSNSINKLSNSDTGVTERDLSNVNIKTTRSGTGIIDIDQGKTTKAKDMAKSGTEVMKQGKNKTSASKEHIKPGSRNATRDSIKTSNQRELTKSGTVVDSQDKSLSKTSRTNTGIRSKNQNLQF